MPVEAVVPVLSSIVEHFAVRFLDNLIKGFSCPVSSSDKLIEVRYVSLMVLAVVVVEGLGRYDLVSEVTLVVR